MDFEKRIQKANEAGIFQMDGYFIWCGSVIKSKNGTYYLFASRWDKKYNFQGWLTHSSIIRAVSDSPTGPFHFQDELVALKSQTWCDKMVHNPTVIQFQDKFYLYYVGTTYNPKQQYQLEPPYDHTGRYHQQIGVAYADDPANQWIPCEKNPILSPREDCWDCTFVTNPAVYIDKSGELHMIYKARDKSVEKLMLGLADAKGPMGPFHRNRQSRLFDYDIEDPFVWIENDAYWMVAKDMSGTIVGHIGDVALFTSEDGVDWKVSEHSLAWRRIIAWEDGREEAVLHMERPQMLIEDGKPVCLYTAIGDFTSIKIGNYHIHSGTYSYNLARKIL